MTLPHPIWPNTLDHLCSENFLKRQCDFVLCFWQWPFLMIAGDSQSEWMSAYKLELERTFMFSLHQPGKNLWFVSKTGTSLPKSNPLLTSGTKVGHPYSLPALNAPMGLKFFSSAMWEDSFNTPTCPFYALLPFQLIGTIIPSKSLGAKGWRKTDCWPGSLCDKVKTDTLPTLFPITSVVY